MVPFHNPTGSYRPTDAYRSSNDWEKVLPTKSRADDSTPNMTTVLVGPKQHAFKVDKKLLCAASPFFQERLEDPSQSRQISLWLPGESAAMFALFVEWVHLGSQFRAHLDEAIINAHETSEQASQHVHWAIIRLHLFASHLGLYELQDLAMDSVQDLYLRCDWDVPPGLITFLYVDCEALPAVRLRRWAVAMVAFSLTGGSHLKFHPQDSETSDPSRFQALLDELPEFAADYSVHSRKMAASGLDVRFKNPQLRIPANRLRNEERAFGFRQCSFHSHRARVGQHRCPHAVREVKRRRAEVRPPSSSSDDDVFDYHDKRFTNEWGMGLTAPSRRDRDAVPRPFFTPGAMEGEEEAVEKAMKHVRSISSTLNV